MSAEVGGQLAGKLAVVTGGGAGIGGAVSRALAGAGARVVVAEIDPERAEAVTSEIASAGGDAVPVVCDVRESEAVERVLEAAGGPADVLVNLDIEFHDELDAPEIEAAVDRLERAIKARHPEVSRIFIEAEKLGPAEDAGADVDADTDTDTDADTHAGTGGH